MVPVPPRTFLGRPGVEAEYREAPDVPDEIAASEPFRPKWAGYLHHPRTRPEMARPVLRRADGRAMRPHTVYDPDGRRFFVPSDYPMQCIGRIDVFDNPSDMSRRRIGTATLVGPRTIVTAAHCMPRDGSPGRWGAIFTPAYFNGISMVGMASWCEGYRVATTKRVRRNAGVRRGGDEALRSARLKPSAGSAAAPMTMIGRTSCAGPSLATPGSLANFASNAAWPTIEEGVR